MASSRKRSTSARSARKRSHSQELPQPPASTAEDLIARCHGIAEDLNGRGAFDLAVPFYRQTIALLLAERNLRQPPDPSTLNNLATLSLAEDDEASPSLELEQHLMALEEDLSGHNALTVQRLLMELQGQSRHGYAPLLALLAKTYLLQGDLQTALDYYQQALALAPEEAKLIVNTAAASLACGDPRAALRLLRPLARRRQAISDPRVLRSLLSNLALAELEAGVVAEAALVRAELAGLAPDDLPLEEWLADARRWAETGHREDAKRLLSALRAVHPRHRGVLALLAQLLEELGDFRDAALVYRDLLRPSLAAP